ncbi:MAG: acyl-ACP--UDP-N-acetylglucosamine O-acyltransferase [Candidatus Kapabacteria bacterium]|nr:acyl-ACP--UDP-N-acetylglucosamine O-acyltransferase [Ignavibacteriota bacterium]MCW5885949.1 acyl-ACP--UDP-N-acetylglucosamine O-acyltransferase [Candidatus Kapabacteria bacterium]
MLGLIHSTAIVSEKAKIGANVKIGAFTIIEDDVEIGDNCEIRSSVIIADGARIGNNCKIYAGAILSTEPQDLKFDGEPTYVRIGDNTVVREFATINRGTNETGETVIGSNCLIMAYCHVAHDCHIGNNVIISNITQLAGHVNIEDWVVLGGAAKIHQFCTVGKHSMVGADCKVVKDVPPFTLVDRKPAQVEGVNKVGLRRRGFSKETIQEIEQFYDTILFSGFNNRDGIAKFNERKQICDDVKYCIDFIENSVRGIHR